MQWIYLNCQTGENKKNEWRETPVFCVENYIYIIDTPLELIAVFFKMVAYGVLVTSFKIICVIFFTSY